MIYKEWGKIMKGLIKKLTLLSILPLVTLTGCNNGGGQTDPPEPKVYWSEEIDDYLKESLNEFYNQVPIFTEGELIEGEVDEENGITYTIITLETELSLQMANLAYKTALMSNEYSITSLNNGYYQAAKSVSLEYVLVVNYGVYKNRGDDYNTFYIQTYLYRDKLTEWPSEELEDFFGCEIPEFEAPYYQFQRGVAEDDIEMVAIAAFGAGKDSETTYMGILKDAGYVVRTGTSTCSAVSHEDRVNLEFYYEEANDVLVIYGSILTEDLTWPTTWLRGLLKDEELPVYSDPAVTYGHGRAVLENGEYYNIVECQYAPKSSLMSYTKTLVDAGWELEDEDADLPDYWPIFIATEGHMARFHKGTHEVEVRYYDPDDLLTGYNYELYYPILMIIIYK